MGQILTHFWPQSVQSSGILAKNGAHSGAAWEIIPETVRKIKIFLTVSGLGGQNRQKVLKMAQ